MRCSSGRRSSPPPGAGVEVLAQLADGAIVAAREGSLIATSFHPELTPDTRFHELLAKLAQERRRGASAGRPLAPAEGR